MILVTFEIAQLNVSEGEAVKAYVQAVPRLGETVFLRIGQIRVTTQVIEVKHAPALNLNSIPSILVTLRTLNEQQLQARRTQAL